MRRRVLAAAGCVVLLAGCGGAAETIEAGGVSVLVSERLDAGMAALLPGTVEVVGGCLGARGVVVVWPHGTRVVDTDPLTVDVPGSGRVGPGDEVSLGGGFVVEHGSTPTIPDPLVVAGATVPPSCVEHDVFLAHA